MQKSWKHGEGKEITEMLDLSTHNGDISLAEIDPFLDLQVIRIAVGVHLPCSIIVIARQEEA